MQTETTFFGTQIVKYNVDKTLIDELLKIGKEQTESWNMALVANIEKELNYSDKDKKYFTPKISEYIMDYIEKYVAPREVDIEFSIDTIDMWINFQKCGEFNQPHIHPGHLSFVIYVDIPKEIYNEKLTSNAPKPGSITFTHGQFPQLRTNQSRLDLKMDNALLPKWLENQLPKTGEMIVFPSFMNHYIQAFKTEGIERVSVAGNAFLKGKYKIKTLL